MKVYRIFFFLFALIAGGLFYLLNYPHGEIPPAGKLLNPFAGFWRNGSSLDNPPTGVFSEKLYDSVVIRWDDRRVPHIFARNDHDLFFAQGYVTAMHRLWQMEFIAMATQGRLSEIVGSRALEYDRYRRRVGLRQAAETSLKEILADPQSRLAVEAYAAGVNAYISTLNPARLPIEYKLLDYRPEPWTPLKSALMIKMMAWDLTGYAMNALNYTRAGQLLGEKAAERLYPDVPPFTDPIVPPGTQWDFHPTLPQPPESLYQPPISDPAALSERPTSRGSNNWAVSGRRTKSGYPILCNDPHLGLNLPSIWYENQLVSPNGSTYGVSMPGNPLVVIGFNDNIAWGLTNAETDVIDWYEITLDSAQDAYLYNGDWLPIEKRVEEIKLRGGGVVYDTVWSTRFGPIVYRHNEIPFDKDVPVGAAMRWTGAQASNEILALLKLDRARDYDDYVQALTTFGSPGQNFAFASATGDIAIVHNGLFPVRWQKQGRYIADGSDSIYDWHGWIPRDRLPLIKNPRRGFVSSANQYPAGPDYPYYMTGNYAPWDRGARINERLSEISQASAENMRELQDDLLNMQARKVLPAMLSRVDRDSLTAAEAAAFDTVGTWDLENASDRIGASIFEFWWDELSSMTWNDNMNGPSFDVKPPRRDVTVELILSDPQSRYFDNCNTPERETLTDICLASFKSAIRKLTGEYGPMGEKWTWGNVWPTHIFHLARIPGFGRVGLPGKGRYGIVNATNRTVGPSWRMVVELGPHMKAQGVYPGGQSGNPGSSFYDDGIGYWLEGKLYDLLILTSPDTSDTRLTRRTLMRNER